MADFDYSLLYRTPPGNSDRERARALSALLGYPIEPEPTQEPSWRATPLTLDDARAEQLRRSYAQGAGEFGANLDRLYAGGSITKDNYDNARRNMSYIEGLYSNLTNRDRAAFEAQQKKLDRQWRAAEADQVLSPIARYLSGVPYVNEQGIGVGNFPPSGGLPSLPVTRGAPTTTPVAIGLAPSGAMTLALDTAKRAASAKQPTTKTPTEVPKIAQPVAGTTTQVQTTYPVMQTRTTPPMRNLSDMPVQYTNADDPSGASYLAIAAGPNVAVDPMVARHLFDLQTQSLAAEDAYNQARSKVASQRALNDPQTYSEVQRLLMQGAAPEEALYGALAQNLAANGNYDALLSNAFLPYASAASQRMGDIAGLGLLQGFDVPPQQGYMGVRPALSQVTTNGNVVTVSYNGANYNLDKGQLDQFVRQLSSSPNAPQILAQLQGSNSLNDKLLLAYYNDQLTRGRAEHREDLKNRLQGDTDG